MNKLRENCKVDITDEKACILSFVPMFLMDNAYNWIKLEVVKY